MKKSHQPKPFTNYINKKIIGSGGYGDIFQCIDKETGQVLAIKKMSFDNRRQGYPSTTLRQISTLKKFNHQNIIKLKNVVIQQQNIYLVFQYFSQDLNDFINRYQKDRIDIQNMKIILKSILLGLVECHKKFVVHRDIKPANILMNSLKSIKIADFGIARVINNPILPYTIQSISALWYRAPEILLQAPIYNTAIDIWGVGCIFAELILKRILFRGSGQLDQINRIFRVLGTPTQKTWPGVSKLPEYKNLPFIQTNSLKNQFKQFRLESQSGFDLLQKLLTVNPSDRITAQQALKHPFINDIRK